MGASAAYLGPDLLLLGLLALPAVLPERPLGTIAVAPLLALLSAAHAQLALVAPDPLISFHLGNLIFAVVPPLTVAFSLSRALTSRSCWYLVIASASSALTIGAALTGGWLDSRELADPWFRTAVAVLPCFLSEWRMQSFGRYSPGLSYLWSAPAALASAVLVLSFASTAPIRRVAFDESHGPWESTEIEIQPHVFGREALYSYTLLFDLAKTLVGEVFRVHQGDRLPDSADTLYILKTPVTPLSTSFSRALADWVRAGGRLLVVLDHTDLFGMTQIMNPWLRTNVGVAVASDAVFDEIGLPASHSALPSARLRGRVDADSTPVPYQTGASFESLPWDATVLSSYGVSYAEPANYATENRFGPFQPSVSYRLSNHPSLIAVPLGRGAVFVLTDSTFWSNFSLTLEIYQQLFASICSSASRAGALAHLPVARIALACTAILALAIPRLSTSLLAALALGTFWGLSFSISSSLHPAPHSEGRPAVSVGLGRRAGFELLPELVTPGTENYARAIVALTKYGYLPVTNRLSGTQPPLALASRWLLLQPSASELPDADDVREAVRDGSRVVVLFSEDQAGNRKCRQWLSSLGLRVFTRRALALSESLSELLDPQGPQTLAFRRRQHLVLRSSFSNWSVSSKGVLVTELRLRSADGSFAVGFSAERFADLEIGDVWEGTDTSMLSRAREAQLAALISGNPLEPLGNDPVMAAELPESGPMRLPRFALFANGRLADEGSLRPGEPPSKSTRTKYLSRLQALAMAHAALACPTESQLCEAAFISFDLIEWKMKLGREQGISTLELLHPKSFSGGTTTYNVVFTSK